MQLRYKLLAAAIAVAAVITTAALLLQQRPAGPVVAPQLRAKPVPAGDSRGSVPVNPLEVEYDLVEDFGPIPEDELHFAGTITGTVRDEHGLPVGGVLVSGLWPAGDEFGDPIRPTNTAIYDSLNEPRKPHDSVRVRSSVTGHDGRYTLTHLPHYGAMLAAVDSRFFLNRVEEVQDRMYYHLPGSVVDWVAAPAAFATVVLEYPGSRVVQDTSVLVKHPAIPHWIVHTRDVRDRVELRSRHAEFQVKAYNTRQWLESEAKSVRLGETVTLEVEEKPYVDVTVNFDGGSPVGQSHVVFASASGPDSPDNELKWRMFGDVDQPARWFTDDERFAAVPGRVRSILKPGSYQLAVRFGEWVSEPVEVEYTGGRARYTINAKPPPVEECCVISTKALPALTGGMEVYQRSRTIKLPGLWALEDGRLLFHGAEDDKPLSFWFEHGQWGRIRVEGVRGAGWTTDAMFQEPVRLTVVLNNIGDLGSRTSVSVEGAEGTIARSTGSAFTHAVFQPSTVKVLVKYPGQFRKDEVAYEEGGAYTMAIDLPTVAPLRIALPAGEQGAVLRVRNLGTGTSFEVGAHHLTPIKKYYLPVGQYEVEYDSPFTNTQRETVELQRPTAVDFSR